MATVITTLLRVILVTAVNGQRYAHGLLSNKPAVGIQSPAITHKSRLEHSGFTHPGRGERERRRKRERGERGRERKITKNDSNGQAI